MSQNTAEATTVQRKQGINEAGREVLCGQADCRIFCIWPLTCAWPLGRTVAVMHSIPNRSDWLCVKFPGLCHSNMSCVFGCHSTLFMKDDLLGQRSQTDCPQDMLAPDGFCCICIRLKFLNWLLIFKKLEEICIPGFLEKVGGSDNIGFCNCPVSMSHVLSTLPQAPPSRLLSSALPAWLQVHLSLRALA